MAIVTVAYQPATGRTYVDLTSWAGSASFTATPVAGDQIEGPDTLTLNADGTVTGADGTYTLRHIIATTGATEGISHTLSSPVPAGTITLGTPTVGETSISLPFTYNDTDQTGFEHRVDGGAWTATTSPVSLTGLTADTAYVIEVRAVNADGGGAPASTTITTDVVPSSATATVPYTAGTNYTTATLEAGFDPYNFQQWPTGEPAVGWQVTTLTADGYFDSQGNYWSSVEHVHDVWFTDLNGVTYYETVDNTGLEQPLTGTITIDPPVVGRTTATVTFSYSAADADGYEYRLDGGAWTNVVSPISLSGLDPETPYTVDIRTYSATTQSVASSVTFTTDSAVDTTPSAFSFTPQTEAARGITVTSNAIAVQGVDAGVDVPISVSGDTGSQYSVSTDGGATWGGWTSADTNVRLNYQVRVRHTTSNEYSSGGYDGVRETTVTIGGVTGTFTSTTLADTTDPVISLTGGNQTVTQGDTWVEPGYTATDNADGDITVSGVVVTGSVDTSALGEYVLTYTATDASGNQTSTTRTVTVVEPVPTDTEAPTISLVGGNMTIEEGGTFVEPGYSATDNVDGDLTNSVTVTGSVDTSVPGTYLRTYSVTDAAGNTGTATRTVVVNPLIVYPLSSPAPASRTYDARRLTFSASHEPLFVLQSGEVLDFDFDLTDWIAEQGSPMDEDTRVITELAKSLTVVGSGQVTGTDRIKVWLKAETVKDSESSLVQLKIATNRYQTGVFQFRVVVINRMQ